MGEDRTPYNTDRTQADRKLTVAQAADILDISSEAVRARVRRNQLGSKKIGGTLYVYLPDEVVHDQTESDTDHTPHEHKRTEEQTLLVEVLRQQLEEANRANSELRRLLAAALERVPAIEAPEEPPDERDPPETATVAPSGSTGPVGEQGDTGQPRASWWR